ncbi:MAG: phenylalanine--tRNA ligase subunit beta [Nanoarchaeota archaeon]|nr:phenylalanine--tRNA ligase subunit beta [Nanoarchaeota archaeon]
MPKIEVSKKDLMNLTGIKISFAKLKDILLEYLKADVEDVKGDILTIKLEDTNRPDLWCVEGIARALRVLLGKGSKHYNVKPSGITIEVDKKLKNIRPYIACGIIKNVKITDDILKSIIQYQEKLGGTYGRKRAKAALGVYDFDKIKGKRLHYKAAKPNSIKFTPLDFNEELPLNEVLKKHPKGIEYAHLLKDKKYYPVILDSDGKVLSMPPIINSNEAGKVTLDTKNLFVEVTGTDFQTVMNMLNLFVMAIAERGGKLYSVRIKYNYPAECGFEVSPKFLPTPFNIKPSHVNKMLGLGLTLTEIKKLLRKMDYKILRADSVNDIISLEIPFYRKDVMHAVDIIEDIAIAYGYNNIAPIEPRISTKGKLLPETNKHDLIRELMIGMGFQEVFSFTLTSKDVLFDKMNTKGKCIEIMNPMSRNYSVLRNSILPILMNFLKKNKTVEFPQKIFELGPIILPDEKSYNKAKQLTNLCVVIAHSKANFTEIKSVLETLMKNLGKEIKLKHAKHKSFIYGRCGEIILNGKAIGIIGEIHPKVLENFDLENPVVAFEINVDEL